MLELMISQKGKKWQKEKKKKASPCPCGFQNLVERDNKHALKAVKGFKFYLIPLFGFSIQEIDLDLYCCVGVYIITSLI